MTGLIHDLFEQGDVNNRSHCLTAQTYFETILANIHPYFNCPKHLLSKLRWALYLGHLHDGVEHYSIHSVILTILEDIVVELQEHRNDQEIVEAKGNRRKKWKALRQVPDGSSHPSNIGRSSLVSEAQSNQRNMAAVDRPDSPPLASRRSKRLKGEAPSHASVEKF